MLQDRQTGRDELLLLLADLLLDNVDGLFVCQSFVVLKDANDICIIPIPSWDYIGLQFGIKVSLRGPYVLVGTRLYDTLTWFIIWFFYGSPSRPVRWFRRSAC